MIDLFCACRVPRKVDEAGIGRAYACEKCHKTTYLISAEKLEAGNGAGDFDAAFTVLDGPEHVGCRVQLGGVTDITLGKSPDRTLCLTSSLKVSRNHARLVRQDFGPSKWKIVDCRSTNGLFVNDRRVEEQDLKDGDVVQVGEYLLQYGHVAAVVAAVPAPAASGVVCPGCEKSLPKKAKICVECGLNVLTGRPVLTRQGVDEDSLYAGAESWIRLISLLVWVTPFPIPIRSEAFGTRKTYAIWTIAVATILASITYFVAERMNEGTGQRFAGADLMLWSPAQSEAASDADAFIGEEKIRDIATRMSPGERAALRAEYAKKTEKVTDDELVRRYLNEELAKDGVTRGEFHAYQLVTHAFLHDTSSVYNFAMHLGGNLVFMLCFGTRVNALIGNLATAVLYPVLAVCAAWAHLLSLGHGPSGPMVGASGAIMGLAGMYLVLFPVHKVFCAMWISIWLRFRRIYGCKIFTLRGFWILLIYFGYDIAMQVVNTKLGLSGGVAHWAHIGGFTTGFVIATALLLSRLFDTHGGDILSVMLGHRAWAIIGKPGRKHRGTAADATPAYA